MEQRRRQFKFLGFLDSRSPQVRSKVIARVRAGARARTEELNGGGGDMRSFFASRNVKIENTRDLCHCQCYRGYDSWHEERENVRNMHLSTAVMTCEIQES